jgi:hypothetical protein
MMCSKCKTSKARVKGGKYTGLCHKCRRAEYYIDHKEEEKRGCQKWYKAHRESEIEKNKEYRKQNRELFDWYHNKDRFNGLREVVFERDEGMCLCGSKYQLSIHHIDGTGYASVGSFNSNNDVENLILLCNSCHHKLHHYQKRNKKVLKNRHEIAVLFPWVE